MYFDQKIALPSSIAILPKTSSATKSLSASLLTWGLDTERANAREIDAKRVVTDSLARREDRAVTAALFSSASSQSTHPETAIAIVRRQISLDYTKHFMSVLDSDIPTGMRGISFFDGCSMDFPWSDIPILHALATATGARSLVEGDWGNNNTFWEDHLHRRRPDDEIGSFLAELDIFKSALLHSYKSFDYGSKEQFRIFVLQILERVRSHLNYGELKVGNRLHASLKSRLSAVISLLENSANFRDSIRKARADHRMTSNYKFLLMVATETERESVLEKAQSMGYQTRPIFGGGRAYHDLGSINGNRVALVKVEMGSNSVGGSMSTTMRMVDLLKPYYIIMVGIAFGVDEEKQSIGTVLISRQLHSYEQQRVGTSGDGNVNIVPRGDKTSASPILVSLLTAASTIWNDSPVDVGLLLSGEKLVDNIDFREQLKVVTGGEAIGGEMEGGGLMGAAAETGTHWIVVKAICDWADGKKSVDKKSRQKLAADNATSLVFTALHMAQSDIGEQ